jgi:PAS domain S-box-containing protein
LIFDVGLARLIWQDSCPDADWRDLDDLTRFSEAIDQSLTEAVRSYTEQVKRDREALLEKEQAAQQNVQDVHALLAAIIDSSDDAIVSKDLNGIVQSWNQAAERMFGYTAAEIVGNSITLLFPPDRLDEETKILEQIRRGQRVDHFETVRTRKDGRQLDVSITISPVKDPTGRIIGVSKVARDITSIKRVLREREDLLERETAARTEAERVGRMKDEFLATLSHELRTPLSAILGWATLLRSEGGATQSEFEEGIEIIERNARSQAQLIEELLDMSRVINGKLRLDVQPVDLQAVVSDAVASIRPSADAKGIRVTHVLDPKGGPITGDPNRLQQVLWNLLTNAVKFTPKSTDVTTPASLDTQMDACSVRRPINLLVSEIPAKPPILKPCDESQLVIRLMARLGCLGNS